MTEISAVLEDTRPGHVMRNLQHYVLSLTNFQSFMLQTRLGKLREGSANRGVSMPARLRPLVTTLIQHFVRLRADQRGNIAVIVAFLLPALIGALGLGFEVANWYLITRSMQNAADSATIAAATNGSANYATEDGNGWRGCSLSWRRLTTWFVYEISYSSVPENATEVVKAHP